MTVSTFNPVSIKREADALIGQEVLGPTFSRYATSPELAQSDEGQRYLHHLAIWMTTAAAAHVRLETRDLATVTHRFATGIVPLRGPALAHALDQFIQAMVAVNPDLGTSLPDKRFALNEAPRRLVEATLLRHPSFVHSRPHAEAVDQLFQRMVPERSRPRGP